MRRLAGLEETAVAHGVDVALDGLDALAEALARLAAERELRARKRREDRVTGAVCKNLGPHHVALVCRQLKARH